MTRIVPLLVALGCLYTAPAVAQEPRGPVVPSRPQSARGPVLQPEFARFEPTIAERSARATAGAAAAAADRVTITITTLGLVLLVVLLVLLIT
jgi:hypothetical protein